MKTSTGHQGPSANALRWVIGAVLLMLLAALLFAPRGAFVVAGPWFWLAAAFFLLLLWSLLAAPGAAEHEEAPPPHMLPPEEQPPAIREVMDVRLAEEEQGVRLFRGRLRESADAVFARLKAAFGNEAVPLMQPDERCGAAILLVPKPVARDLRKRPTRTWLHWLLFALTFLTTTWAGAAHQGVNLLREPGQFAIGLPYSIGLLAILGVHEFGHYWVARVNGMNVTPPFFVPVPFALGTFGAFIQMRSPSENRRALFDVAVAGPLAGLLVAIPALLIGLRTSEVLPAGLAPQIGHGALPGSSILFTALAKLALGTGLQPGDVIRLGPLAFAGWLGLLVTGLNLLPIGQLDGGHIARAMFGSRAGAVIGGIAMWSLVLLGLLVWPGLLIWALIVFFIAGRGTPPLNDITPVGAGRFWLGLFAFAILLLVMVPASVFRSLANQSPYI